MMQLLFQTIEAAGEMASCCPLQVWLLYITCSLLCVLNTHSGIHMLALGTVKGVSLAELAGFRVGLGLTLSAD